MKLRAPFPYFGYKGKISPVVWEHLGNPDNYVEPFFGSGAVLLQRPQAGKREVINDKYGHVVNFWRSVQTDPDGVCEHAITIAAESELHARNAACRKELENVTSLLEGDPNFHDSRMAGWWCFVQCMAIGECAFARGPWIIVDGELVHRDQADGIRRAVPCDADRGIQKSVPFHGLQGIMARREYARDWIHRLSQRIAGVRILCGDWSRAVKPTYTTQHGLTGVFLDKPYNTHYKVYPEADPINQAVCAWCAENGSNPNLRIAMCGYAGTLAVDLVKLGWLEHAWVAGGGRITTGGQSDENRKLERIWFSPHCVKPAVVGQLSLLEAL